MLEDGVLIFGSRKCIPNDVELKREGLSEAHQYAYIVHPGSTKVYQNLHNYFWWNNKKQEIAEFASHYLVCQQIKVEHQKPPRLLQSLPILKWK